MATLSRIEMAEIRRRAEAWLLWGERDAFTAGDLRDLIAELDALRRELTAARRRAAS